MRSSGRFFYAQALVLAPQTGVFGRQIRTGRRDRRLRMRAPRRSRFPPIKPRLPCCAIARLWQSQITARFSRHVKGRWKTFGSLGRMKLMLDSAHEIVENDPMFRIPRSR
jgi:hypothetical protein